MRRRFWWSYVLLGFFVIATWTVCLISYAAFKSPLKPAQRNSRPSPIGNSTAPNEVEMHFKSGKEYSQAPATSIGMKDGTCYVYTNEVSWLAMECFGTVK